MQKKKLVSTLPILKNFEEDITKKWYVEYYNEKGKRIRIFNSINCEHTIENRKAAAQIVLIQLATGLTKVKNTESVIYQHLQPLLIEHCVGLRPASIHNYKTCLNIFEGWLLENKYKDLHPKKFGKVEVAAFLRYLEFERKLANRTYNKYLQLLKTLFNKLIEVETIGKNPFILLKSKIKNSQSATAFKEFDMIKLREVFKVECPNLYFACMLQLYAFIRPGEIRQLLVSDLNLEEGVIEVRGDVSKNKKTQRVAIVPPLREIIMEHLGTASICNSDFLISKSGKVGSVQVSGKYLLDKHKAILKGLKYDTAKFQLYSWKHTGNALAYKNGAALRFLKLQNRHHSEVMTEIYIKSIVPEDLISSQEQFFNF